MNVEELASRDRTTSTNSSGAKGKRWSITFPSSHEMNCLTLDEDRTGPGEGSKEEVRASIGIPDPFLSLNLTSCLAGTDERTEGGSERERLSQLVGQTKRTFHPHTC